MRIALLLAMFLVVTVPLLAQDQPPPNPPMTPGMACPMPGMGMGGMQGTQGAPGMMGQMPGMGGMQGMMCPMCQMMGMGGMLPGQMYVMHADALGLTDDQVRKIQDIQTDFRRQQVRTGSEIQLDQIDLQQEMMKDSPDAAKAEKLMRDINRLQGDQQVAAMKASVAAKNVLTPEQRKTAGSMMMRPPMPAGTQPMPMIGPGVPPAGPPR